MSYLPEHGRLKSTDKESKLRVICEKNRQETGDCKRPWPFFGKIILRGFMRQYYSEEHY